MGNPQRNRAKQVLFVTGPVKWPQLNHLPLLKADGRRAIPTLDFEWTAISW